MANIFDYVIWRGDLPISDGAPFTEVDGLILSRFTYLPFERVQMASVDTIGGVCKVMSRFKETDFHLKTDLALVQFLAESDRYRKLKITDYVQETDVEKGKQFAAISVHLPTQELYIGFRGTDGTVVGWREDFDMTYKCPVPSQKAALRYATETIEAYPGADVRIGGHSKGGNLAVYAAAFLPEELQDRVVKVCNYDGPGFLDEALKAEGFQRLKGRVHTYVPQDSIFGRMLFHDEDIEVIKSDEKSIYQHDTFSWEVLGAKMVRCETGVTEMSNINADSLHKIIENTSPEDRELALDVIFGFVEAGDIDSISELKSSMATNTMPYLKNLVSIRPNQMKSLWNVVTAFVSAYSSSVVETGTQAVSQVSNDLYVQAVPKPVQDWIQQQVDLRSQVQTELELKEQLMEAKAKREERIAEGKTAPSSEAFVQDLDLAKKELEYRKCALEARLAELETRIKRIDEGKNTVEEENAPEAELATTTE